MNRDFDTQDKIVLTKKKKEIKSQIYIFFLLFLYSNV